MHICYCEKGYPHPHGGGGAGTFVQLAGRELVRRGHFVSVIAEYCPDCGEMQVDQGVQVYRPKTTGNLHWFISRIPIMNVLTLSIRSLEGGLRVGRLIEKIHQIHSIDLIEFSDGGDIWHTLRHSIPYVVHLHGSRYTFLKMSGRPVTRGDWLDRKIGLWCIRKSDQVISPSQAMLDEVQIEAGMGFPKAVVIPYPLDPRLLQNSNILGEIQNDAPARVFFAARNDPVKGGDVLIRAIPLIQKSYPDVEFQFFGYQPSADLKEIAGQAAHFSPFLPKDRLLQEYTKSDICVIPSFWDNSPNTIYEGMASAKPVVVSRAGGMPELIINGKTGILVEPGSPEQLTDAILILLKDKNKRLEMGQAARQHILEIAEFSKNIDRRLELYSAVIKS